MRIFVGNFPWSTTEDDLLDLFNEYGDIKECSIVMDRETGKSKGFAFLEMEDDREAARAIEQLHGVRIQGRSLNVSEARPRGYAATR